MNRIVNFLQKYFSVISILIGISIVLSMTFSNYIVTSNNHKAAEMYIGELKYSVEIDGSLNTLTVPKGETVVDVRVSNLNPVDTYYKLLYLKNSNITIKYYESTKDTDEVITTYSKPNDSIKGNNSNYIKLIITNNSTTTQNVALTMKGGYITNTIDDIIVPSTYSDITEIESTKTNTYFCKTDASLEQGLKYVNGQFTYAYKQQGASSTSGLGWTNINSNGWGVQLTDKTSTDAVTSKFCTYINNKPTTSTVMMFYNSKAGSIDFTNFDTSKVTNMASMFYETQTPVLDVSNFDTSRVINMYCMFYKTIATTLDVSNFDTSKVNNMRSMFDESKVTTLDLSNFDTSKVTNMKSMFYKSNVTTLDVSNFDTSKVTDMSYMFGYASAATLDVSNFDTSNVTDMSYMFGYASAATLDVSNFSTSNVTNMKGMFWATKVKSLDLSNFNTSNVTIMDSMFFNSQVTTLDVSSFDTSKVISMSSMFYGTKVTTLDLSNFNTSNVTNMSGLFRESSVTALNLTNFDTSKVTNMASMFGKLNLNALNLSNFDTSNVIDMSFMFINSKISNLNVSSFNTSKVTNMRCMFCSFKSATLDVSNFDTSKVTNMSDMFSSSTLNTIYVSNKFDTSSVINTTDTLDGSTNMFKNCTNLVGGSGTKYNSSYVDKTYARIDGGTSNPGYFTDAADKNIPAPNSFATDSWKTIIKSVRNNNISKYNVGDTKTVDMGTYGTHTLRIANTSTPNECSTTGFSQTACGFVLEFADIITEHNMNPSGTYKGTQYDYGWNKDGWPATSMRTFVNNDIYNAIPSEIKNAIIDTTVVSGHGKSDTENFTSTDKLYLLAPKEIYTDWSKSYDTARDNTRQLDYYKNLGTSTSNYSGAIKENGTSAKWWWLRAAGSSTTDIFFGVDSNGGWRYNRASSTCGVAPAFRIG